MVEKTNEAEPTVTPAEDGGVIVDLPGENNDGVVVAIDGGAPDNQAEPPEKAAPVVGPDPEQKLDPKLNEAVEELRSQLQAQKDREAAAVQERVRVEQHNRQLEAEKQRWEEDTKKLQAEMLESRRSEIDSSIAAAQSAADAGRREYEAALASGDFQKVSEANLKVNRAAAQMVMLEDRKANFDESARTPPVSGRVEAPPPADRNETFIQSQSPRTQVWLRRHMECVTDQRMSNKTASAHYDALAEGITPETDAYYGYLDQKLGFAQTRQEMKQETTKQPSAAEPPKRATPKPIPAAAPVSHQTPRQEANRVYLTRSEMETADSLGISHAEYGKRKRAMEKQGFYH